MNSSQLVLKDKWVFWLERDASLPNGSVSKENFLNGLRPVESFSEVQKISGFAGKTCRSNPTKIFLFKENILPCWEDPRNIDGGRFYVLCHSKKEAIGFFIRCIHQLLEEDGLCGLVYSRKAAKYCIQLWLENAEVSGRFISKINAHGGRICYKYCPHRTSPSFHQPNGNQDYNESDSSDSDNALEQKTTIPEVSAKQLLEELPKLESLDYDLQIPRPTKEIQEFILEPKRSLHEHKEEQTTQFPQSLSSRLSLLDHTEEASTPTESMEVEETDFIQPNLLALASMGVDNSKYPNILDFLSHLPEIALMIFMWFVCVKLVKQINE